MTSLFFIILFKALVAIVKLAFRVVAFAVKLVVALVGHIADTIREARDRRNAADVSPTGC